MSLSRSFSSLRKSRKVSITVAEPFAPAFHRSTSDFSIANGIAPLIDLLYANQSPEVDAPYTFGTWNTRVPKLVLYLTLYLMENGKTTEGLFRVNGSLKRIRLLAAKITHHFQDLTRTDYEGFKDLMFGDDQDKFTIHDVAHFLKKVLIGINSTSTNAIISASLNTDIQQVLNAPQNRGFLQFYAALFEAANLPVSQSTVSVHQMSASVFSAASRIDTRDTKFSAIGSVDSVEVPSWGVAPEISPESFPVQPQLPLTEVSTVHSSVSISSLQKMALETLAQDFVRNVAVMVHTAASPVSGTRQIATLLLMLRFLRDMAAHHETTKMTALNLSMIFANSIVQSSTLSKAEISLHNYLLYALITHFECFEHELCALRQTQAQAEDPAVLSQATAAPRDSFSLLVRGDSSSIIASPTKLHLGRVHSVTLEVVSIRIPTPPIRAPFSSMATASASASESISNPTSLPPPTALAPSLEEILVKKHRTSRLSRIFLGPSEQHNRDSTKVPVVATPAGAAPTTAGPYAVPPLVSTKPSRSTPRFALRLSRKFKRLFAV